MGESIMQDVKYLYGESLKGKRVTLTIKGASGGVEFVAGDGRKALGFDVTFNETPKVLGVTGVTVRRQLAAALDSDDVSTWPGKRVTLYPVASKKSATGWAIRVARAEGGAS